MIDISRKISTLRIATAESVLTCSPSTVELIRTGGVPKGDPLSAAKLAAVQAAKNTSQIIPYCHPLPIEAVDVVFDVSDTEIRTQVTVKAVHKTGVEMEALTAATVAALMFYDMMKFTDDVMEIVGTRLLSKTGGKNDFRPVFVPPLRGAIVTVSDEIVAGKKDKTVSENVRARLEGFGVEILFENVVARQAAAVNKELARLTEADPVDLIFTVGGTGFGVSDVVPEVTLALIEREAPGIAEALRVYGTARSPFGMLSRGVSGVRGHTLIVNLSGTPRASEEQLDALLPGIFNAVKRLRDDNAGR